MEQDIRINILNTLLTTPHREISNLYPVHVDMCKQDPLFYMRLAAWYVSNGEVRDHKEAFIVTLCTSNFDQHRDVGLALLRELPPYQVVRIVDFISGRKNVKIKGHVIVNYGLGKPIPRSMRTEIVRYLKEREADDAWFDSAVSTAKKHVKRLYALLHVAPSERAQKILFDNQPPPTSKQYAIKTLSNAKTPIEQAKIIIENKIPYRVASTIIDAITPTVMVALIEVMSSQELINNIESLRRRGAFDNPEIKSLIEKKLDSARTNKRVSALKASEAAKASDVSDDIKQKLNEVADTQIKSKGRITVSTALLVDKSGSMAQSIELGKQIAAAISAVMDAPLFVFAFDTWAHPIIANGSDLESWQKAFKGISAGGGTSCGVPLTYMMHKQIAVNQIIIVTDEREVNPPAFIPALQAYCKTMNVDPNVVIVKTVDADNMIETQAKNAGIMVDTWQFNGDYYSVPNLIKFLSKSGKFNLMMDIMEYPLPVRKLA